MSDKAALPRALRPFAGSQYRLLALALTLSLFGSGVWLIAVVWQVVELDGAPRDLSIVATAGAMGFVLAVLVGGVAADRISQKRIVFVVEIAKAVTMLTVAGLAFAGALEIWHLALASVVLGVADGFFYPAYSAWLPDLVPAEQLLAANGIEGVLRSAVMQALGPAIASVAITALSPSVAFVLGAVAQGVAALALAAMAEPRAGRVVPIDDGSPLRALWVEVRGGASYVIRNRWLLASLLYSSLVAFAILGPIEVLLPFAIRDQTGGGAGAFAAALAAFGIGGAVGSLGVASMRLPRRYLTVMIASLGIGCLPLALIGVTDQLWVILIALFVCGLAISGGTVVWGTLLQRRVPSEMLGRVSSLDFFVTLAFMPLSMAIAGPLAEVLGIAFMFAIAGIVPLVFAGVTLLVARLGADERAHPLAHL